MMWVDFGDQLHVAVFDAVVDHLDVVTRTTWPDVRNARSVLGFGRDGFEHRLQLLVGADGTARHEGWAPEGTFFAAGDTHTHELHSAGGIFARATLCISVERVATVDQDVAFIEKRREFLGYCVYCSASLHHQEDSTRAFQRVDEFFEGERAKNVGVLAPGRKEFLGTRSRAIVDGRSEAIAGNVEGEVLAHDGQSNDAHVPLATSRFSHFDAPLFTATDRPAGRSVVIQSEGLSCRQRPARVPGASIRRQRAGRRTI